jgi:hypothetical protein
MQNDESRMTNDESNPRQIRKQKGRDLHPGLYCTGAERREVIILQLNSVEL